jgi:DNA invertase Pin-like site-specific DNA recombinase
VTVFRDDGIKGRYLNNRKAFKRMLNDIAAGVLVVDLILVDTLERLGRADEILEIRRRLRDEHGVLVMTADTNFADPTGATGQAVVAMENMRATQDTRIKAHNVTRGKKDTVHRKRWPGGPVPFGFRLKKLIDHSGPEPEIYTVPEPDPEESPVLRRVFDKALASGWGGNRLAEFFQSGPRHPRGVQALLGPHDFLLAGKRALCRHLHLGRVQLRHHQRHQGHRAQPRR